MRNILIVISALGLLLTVVPSFMVFYEKLDFETHKVLATTGTFLWLITAPFWMNTVRKDAAS